MDSSEKKQFDSYIGGEVTLPNNVNIFKFATARANEIAYMEKALKNPSSTKLIFQKLPVHMRRRVMSHNAKRLPRRLRAGHLSQLTKAGMPPKQKRPSRKYRRRPANLQSEYMRRQRRVQWLETHIWHAKRFHMIERWGHKIPDRPCDKSFRALYRASAQHCLIQDISYYHCIELIGDRNTILDKLVTMTHTSTGLGFNARCYLNGRREGETILFYSKNYPDKPIGSVRFLWKPNNSSTQSTLWMWAHPSFSSELVSELKNIFKKELNDQIMIIKDLRHDLNRFKLSGPLSHSLLRHTFQLADENNITENNWFNNYLNTEKEQNQFWKNLNIQSPGELSAHLVLNLVVCDPRFNMPKKRTKASSVDEEYYISDLGSRFPNDCVNPIWDIGTRQQCLDDKLSSSEICNLKSQQLVPGDADSIFKKLACTPVLIIQRPGNQENYTGFSSGYDVIVPTGWGLPLWRTLIMWGGRAGGLREDRVSILENQKGHYLYPDTKAGKLESIRIEKSYKEIYFKLPPKKRMNHPKIGIVSPFRCRWDILVKDWLLCDFEIAKNFYILRNVALLKFLQDCLNKNSKLELDDSICKEPILIPVKINLIDRGSIKDFAIICIPNETDAFTKKQFILEHIHEDLNQSKRKELRKEHLKLLKRLKRKRLRIRRKWKNNPSGDKPIFKSTNQIVVKYLEELKELWLPEPSTVRYSCSRQIIGYITHGDFSFTRAKISGVGYISLQSLAFIKQKQILVRDKNSRYYRYANLDIII